MCFEFTFLMTAEWAFLRWTTNVSSIISIRKMQMATTIAAYLMECPRLRDPNTKLGKVWRNWNSHMIGGMQNENNIIYSLDDHLLFKLTCLSHGWVVLFLGIYARNTYLYSLPQNISGTKIFMTALFMINPNRKHPQVSIKVKSTKILSGILLRNVYKK